MQLRGPVRHQPQTTHLEIQMDSALTPREIQARIRAGEPLSDVARAAGMAVGLGRALRRRRCSPSVSSSRGRHSRIRCVVARRRSRTARSARSSRTGWLPAGSTPTPSSGTPGRSRRVAGWCGSTTTRASRIARPASSTTRADGSPSADNDDARWLLGLHSASHGPQPGRRRRDEEAEPTVELNDELALVRVVQPRVDEPADPDDTVPLEELDEVDDAYAEGELAEVDGVYDIVPDRRFRARRALRHALQLRRGLRPDLRRADPPRGRARRPSRPRRGAGRASRRRRASSRRPSCRRWSRIEPEPDVAEPEQPALVEEPVAQAQAQARPRAELGRDHVRLAEEPAEALNSARRAAAPG